VLDHIGIDVSDLTASRAFYERALEPLGISVLMEVGEIGAGMGHDRKPYFWIWKRGPAQTGIHIAFAAETRELVDEFHAAALAAGGRDNGAPGLRPQYHPTYYGGFVLDLDGNNVEAVCHRPA
jgi:catechol 2,3-dioxygenase-like lactoylglutathione lyase family enzyme